MKNKHLYDYDNDDELEIKKAKIGNRLSDSKKRKKKRNKEKKVEKKSGKKKFSVKKFLIALAIVVAVAIATIGTIFGVYVYKADGNITSAVMDMASDVLGEDEPIFVLILGLSEDISAKLTDTIILAGYNPDSQKAFMLSIPRDTFIGSNENTAGGYDKINSLYQKGPKKTVEAVEKLTGINIANYVVVKNTALPAIVNAIGEIEFDVPIDMDYDDPTQNLHIHLKAGVQMIDGDKAEQLLRFRHNNNGTSYPSSYGDNDYGRMRTQREFIKAIASQVISGNSTLNLKAMATAVFDNIETDMSLVKAISYAPSMVKIDVDSIRMEQLPGASEKLNELWFYNANTTQTSTLIDELLAELELDEQELKKSYTKVKKSSVVKQTTKSSASNASSTKNTNTNTQTDANTNTEHVHDYVQKSVTEATCEKEGKVIKECTTCGKSYSETISKLDHTYETEEVVSGSKKVITVRCKVCGTVKEKKEEKIVPDTTNTISECTAHKYEVTSTEPATCKTAGKETLKCSVCGNETSRILAKLTTHTFGEAVTQTNGDVVKTCTVCGIQEIIESQKDSKEDEEVEEEKTENNPNENTTSASEN